MIEEQRRSKQSEHWENFYRLKIDRWGEVPSPVLVKAAQFAGRGLAIELGSGEGRNVPFLLNQGFEVEAVDLSATALAGLKTKVIELGRDVKTIVGDLRSIEIRSNSYALVVADSVLNFVSREDQIRFLNRAAGTLIPGGVLVVVGFSSEEISSDVNSEVQPILEEDLRELDKVMEIIELSKSFELDLSHGTPHHHHLISFIGQRI